MSRPPQIGGEVYDQISQLLTDCGHSDSTLVPCDRFELALRLVFGSPLDISALDPSTEELLFGSEEASVQTAAKARWPDGPVCPECHTGNPYYIKTQKRWKCRQCRIQFSVKRGTIFEDSAIPLRAWLYTIYVIANSKSGLGSAELRRLIGVTQKSTWFMLRRLSEVLTPAPVDEQAVQDA